MVLPRTIQEVIQELELILDDCQKKHRREGYFAALYLRVTREVNRKIGENYFDDGARMERLDVDFANRYLIAYDQYRQNQPCSASWRIAFEACSRWRPLVMQHLLVGMNAHIGLDLGLAAATVCPGASIKTLHNDFIKINSILSEMVDVIEGEIADIWPLLRPVDWFAGKLDEKLAAFCMNIARDEAWKVALQYAALQEKTQQEDFIRKRDLQVPVCSKKIIRPGLLLNLWIVVFQVFERGTIQQKIQILGKQK